MATILLRANLRRCIVSQRRSASDELGELGKGAGEGSVTGAGASPPKTEVSPEKMRARENGPDYIEYIKRYHSEEIGHHYRQIAFLESSIERHRNKIRKLLFED